MNLILWMIGAFAVVGGSAQPSALQDPSGRDLYMANCAACHGEKGDGEGTAQLERRARSFVDGGFSYGNTPSALQRTIAAGIPGTPMPAWGEALPEEQIRLLADYVIELGPGLPPPPADTEMIVDQHPLVVRGMLPPIGSGAQSHSRGLLIGTPDGFSFEYRSDDLRLLGMRQGRFVDRTDWIGRGGTALQPLGPVVFLEQGGAPQSTFVMSVGGRRVALKARLRGTRVADGKVWIRSLLVDAQGVAIASVEENTRALRMAWGSGYERRWRVQLLEQAVSLGLRGPGQLQPLEDAAEVTEWVQSRASELSGAAFGMHGEDLWIAPPGMQALQAGQAIELFTCRLRHTPETDLEETR